MTRLRTLGPEGLVGASAASAAAGVDSEGHVPVLLAEAIAWLDPRPDGRYIDGTFGGGGHTRAILNTAPGCQVLALDADPSAIERGNTIAADPAYAGRLHPAHANFADMAAVARERNYGPVDGVLLDLGLSSFQLDTPERGFAFRFSAPLDMRFDPTKGQSAADLVNTLDQADLAQIVFRFGEDSNGNRIARAIVAERASGPIETTDQLADLVEKAVGGRRGAPTHPATRTFQALRIAVNDELTILRRALQSAIEILAPGGRLVVISFHSLEDRIVKETIALESTTCICPPEQPVCTCTHQPRLRKLTPRAVKPSPLEAATNPRARSAILRAAERLPDPPAAIGAPR